MFDLPDPSETGGRFELLQNTLRVRGPACRLRGQWAQLPDAELAAPLVLGVDRRGVAVIGRAHGEVALLFPHGRVASFESFETFVTSFVLRAGAEGGVPAVHVTVPLAVARADFLAALHHADDDTADAALTTVLAQEVAVPALLELLAVIAGPTGSRIPHEVRMARADQLWHMARRRAPPLETHVDYRVIQRALRLGGEAPPDVVARLTSNPIVEEPCGIFIAPADSTEIALVSALAEAPDDAGARLVYADYLESRGELERAEAIREEPTVPTALPDAESRGFIAPVDVVPVDSAARIAEYTARWHADDPTTSVDDLLERIAALHPAERQGHALLLALHANRRREAMPHLLHERALAWPYLVLALRSLHPREAGIALELLVDGQVAESRPYLLSALRHPTQYRGDDRARLVERLAEGYVALGAVDRALAEELALHFADDRPTAARTVAFHLCQEFADDERIFEGYLLNFVAAHPMSERALRKRRRDPRVAEVLRAQLEREEKRALFARHEHVHGVYSEAYGILAEYLAKLGDANGKAALDAYREAAHAMSRRAL